MAFNAFPRPSRLARPNEIPLDELLSMESFSLEKVLEESLDGEQLVVVHGDLRSETHQFKHRCLKLVIYGVFSLRFIDGLWLLMVDIVNTVFDWLVVWLPWILFSQNYWESHHPN